MELPQTINTGEGFQELKIKENGENGKVVERVNLQKGGIYSISGNKNFWFVSCAVSYHLIFLN